MSLAAWPYPHTQEHYLDHPEDWERDKKLAKMPLLALREKRREEEAAKARAKVMKPVRTAKRFTTKDTKAEGLRRGWKVIPGGERYDYRTGKFIDGAYGCDVMFKDSDGHRYAVQGAGEGQRAAHLCKFHAYLAKFGMERELTVLYWVFSRLDGLVSEEEWTAQTPEPVGKRSALDLSEGLG